MSYDDDIPESYRGEYHNQFDDDFEPTTPDDYPDQLDENKYDE